MRTHHEALVTGEMVKSTKTGARRIRDSVNITIKVWTHCHGGAIESPEVRIRVWRSDTEVGREFDTLTEAYDYLNSLTPKEVITDDP